MDFIFHKYHGNGNDYLLFDVNRCEYELTAAQVSTICDRHFGVGSDGIIMGPYFKEDGIHIKIYNSDGSEAMTSGNGASIFAQYLKDKDYIKGSNVTIHTLGGPVDVELLDVMQGNLKVAMGKVSYLSTDIPVTGPEREVISEKMKFGTNEITVTCLSIGNPHCAVLTEELSKEETLHLGRLIEGDEKFPDKINVLFLKVINDREVSIQIYERGAGFTLASGTSCCAAANISYKLGLTGNKVKVNMPGGSVFIEIDKDGMTYMTDRVKHVGTIITSNIFVEGLQK